MEPRTANEVYVVSWVAAPSLEQRAKRLVAAAQRQLDEFWDAVYRGEYGDDYMSVAYCESRDRLQAEWQAAVDRLAIIRQGAECGCVMDQHCVICDSVAHVTFSEEE